MRKQVNAVSKCLLALSMIPVWSLGAAPPGADHYEMFVVNDPAVGKEEAYNRWYDLQHAQDVLVNPGYVASQRYVVNDMQMPGDNRAPTRYLIRFKIETADIAKSLGYIHANIRSGRTIMTDTIGRETPGGDFTYQAITPSMSGRSADVRGGRAEAGFIQIIFSSAKPGQEAAYNGRYDGLATELATVPNLVRWQRFRTSPVQLTDGHVAMTRDYMTIYELNPRSVTELVDARRAIADAEARALSGVSEAGPSITYRAIGPMLSGVDVKRARAAAGARYKPAVPVPASLPSPSGAPMPAPPKDG